MTVAYDLSNYKLTLPCNAAGELSGKAHEIMDVEDYRGPWFSFTDDGYLFTCPDGGATTKTAKYPRSELRDMREFSVDESASDKLKFRVLSCPLDHKIVLHQIHDKDEPWVKIVWHQKKDGGSLYALVKSLNGSPDIRIDLLTKIPFGKSIVSFLNYNAKKRQLQIKANKFMSHVPMDHDGSNGHAYFKRGAYFQSREYLGLVCAVEHLKTP